MRRRGVLVLAVLVAVLTSLSAAPAFAESPSERECEAQNGSFDRVRGEVSCVIVEEGKNPKFEQEQTTTGRGNIENKQETSEECNRPGQDEKCPPGQFK